MLRTNSRQVHRLTDTVHAINGVARSFAAASAIPTLDRGGERGQDFRHHGGDLLVVDGMDACEAGVCRRHRQLEIIEHICPRDAC